MHLLRIAYGSTMELTFTCHRTDPNSNQSCMHYMDRKQSIGITCSQSLWGINAPGRIELTSGTWLSPAHISLATLNRAIWLPLWRPLSLPYPRYTPTPSYACWARCIAISSSVDAPDYDPGREEKEFSGRLSLIKPKTPRVVVDHGRGHVVM